ncbi:MAG: ABC transporter substrate-binding protein [Acutalibacter sp.]|jgi:iron complex transport system substrate-binding protein|uniref:peptidoglycan-binding protein n=1 Tax=Acutalibacter sp. TaxID=1918636 RepID=UPI00216E3170|nr:peptidoglycan-binding protein [Acutalibacter sp.]MCI9223870.1 ABC transporter substrate-binding protein [Acutalibacter sp.]
MIKKLLAVILCAGLVLAGMAGCSNVSDLVSGVAAGEFPVTINDVTIGGRPSKVAVLSPSLADVVLALGCETQLAACSGSCTQGGLSSLTKVDPGDVSAITALNPDLVLLDPNSAGAEQALKEAGLTVLNITPAVNREDFERLYSQVSSALCGGGPGYDKGIECAQDIFGVLDDINRLVPQQDTVTTACYLYDLNGSAVTGDTLTSTIMTYCGVTNIFSSLSGGQYSEDDLRVSNPTVIFCRPGLTEELRNDSRYNNLMAVREGNIVELEPSEVEWQGRTVINAAIAISGGAYPEMLEETSIGENTDPTSKIEDNVSSALASARPEDSSAPEYEQLSPEDQSEEVYKMQERLEELGYLDTEYDGYYGEHTGECVKEFQRVNGLEQTGVADVDTLKRLYSTLAKDKDGKVPAMENAPTMGPNSGDNSSSSSSEGGDGSSSEG